MDVPTNAPRCNQAETVREALGTMETHMTWIEGILMLLKREAEGLHRLR
jgi:hypothetical protein